MSPPLPALACRAQFASQPGASTRCEVCRRLKKGRCGTATSSLKCEARAANGLEYQDPVTGAPGCGGGPQAAARSLSGRAPGPAGPRTRSRLAAGRAGLRVYPPGYVPPAAMEPLGQGEGAEASGPASLFPGDVPGPPPAGLGMVSAGLGYGRSGGGGAAALAPAGASHADRRGPGPSAAAALRGWSRGPGSPGGEASGEADEARDLLGDPDEELRLAAAAMFQHDTGQAGGREGGGEGGWPGRAEAGGGSDDGEGGRGSLLLDADDEALFGGLLGADDMLDPEAEPTAQRPGGAGPAGPSGRAREAGEPAARRAGSAVAGGGWLGAPCARDGSVGATSGSGSGGGVGGRAAEGLAGAKAELEAAQRQLVDAQVDGTVCMRVCVCP